MGFMLNISTAVRCLWSQLCLYDYLSNYLLLTQHFGIPNNLVNNFFPFWNFGKMYSTLCFNCVHFTSNILEQ